MIPSRRDFLALSAAGAVCALLPSRIGAASQTGCIRLPDGRRIAFTEHGNPTGSDVAIYHHGLPSARREAEVLAQALCTFPNLRLIAFDRPGIGDSDPVARPSFCSWAKDLERCADALKLDRFALTGTSGGTPFALAAALAMPQRVTRAVMASPVAEHLRGRDNGDSAWFTRLAGSCPRSAKAFMATGRAIVKRSPEAAKKLIPLSPIEKTMLEDPAKLALVAGIMLDATKGGPAGPVAEAALLPGPWGLPLCRIQVPVIFFHGTEDRLAPQWMSPQLAKQIPGATYRIYAGEGHLSLPQNHAAEILATVVGQ